MLLRLFALAAFPLAIAATAPPPRVLQPYIQNGRFNPGDYGWMRGQLVDATPAQRRDQDEIAAWLKACGEAALATSRAALQAEGANPTKLTFVGYKDPLCDAVASAPFLPPGTTYADVARALPEARLAADTFLFAMDMAAASAATPDLPATLLQRPLTEQMLRRGSMWGAGEAGGAPPLSPVALAIVRARIGLATGARDHANTEWLKGLVAREGWPSISKVGEPAATQAWLLVQHADADPAFQYHVLMLMAPLEAAHDLPARNYAYLYDRVMLKLAGKQRYATQMTCSNGKRVPQPLEDATALGRWRRQAGLKLLGDYVADMDRLYGPCPPDAVPPPSATR